MRSSALKEITTTETNGYFITAYWGPRAETPEELAKRFFLMIDAFKQIDPALRLWIYGRRNDLDAHREDFAKFIAKTIERDDWGVVMPNAGYWFDANSPDSQARDRRFVVNCHAGSSIDRPSENKITFSQSTMFQPAPDLHSYRIFHWALAAIVAAWDPVTVEANCYWLVDRTRKGAFPFRPAWMRYLCPALARQATPPASAWVEHLPSGGLLLSATQGTFDVDNPRHVAAAEEIAAALTDLDRSRESCRP
jgi:hypothetical protein